MASTVFRGGTFSTWLKLYMQTKGIAPSAAKQSQSEPVCTFSSNCPFHAVQSNATTYRISPPNQLFSDNRRSVKGTCGPVDCNDANTNIRPGACDVLKDGIDQDCSGSIGSKAKFACNSNTGCTDRINGRGREKSRPLPRGGTTASRPPSLLYDPVNFIAAFVGASSSPVTLILFAA